MVRNTRLETFYGQLKYFMKLHNTNLTSFTKQGWCSVQGNSLSTGSTYEHTRHQSRRTYSSPARLGPAVDVTPVNGVGCPVTHSTNLSNLSFLPAP